MTGNEKEQFHFGILIGILISAAFVLLITIIFTATHPDAGHKPDYYLNSPDWTIDTIRTSSSANNSNTVEYKFVKNSKE